MRSFLFSLLVGGTLLAYGSASAEESGEKGALPPLHPPKADYSAVCNPRWMPAVDTKRDWSEWDGKSTDLAPKELMEYAKLYLKGNSEIPRNPELAYKFLSYLSEHPSNYQGRAKHYLARLYLFGDGVTLDRDKATDLYKEAWAMGIAQSGAAIAIIIADDAAYTEAADYFLKSANLGNANSALALAHMYNNNTVPPPSPDSARVMMTLAENLMLENVAKGSCNALYGFGSMYAAGIVVPQNKEVAREWFEAAANAGVILAMTEVADIYLTQEGGESGAKKAIAMWERAAALGSAEAQFHLGVSYYKGDGTPKDIDKGVYWMERASVFGSSTATEFLVKHYLGEDEENPNYAAAFDWLQRATSLPKANPELLVLLGEAYKLGQGTERDPQKAFQMYEKAAARGSRGGFYKLGEAYLYGQGTEQQPVKSLRFFRLAALQGHQDSTRQLMKMYHCGMGVAANSDTALNWRERAISANSTTAFLDAAEDAYAENTPEAEKKAFSYISDAAEKRDRRGMALLSLAYEYGRGTEKNPAKAKEWMERTLAKGEKPGDGPYTLAQAYLKGYLAPKDSEKARAYLEDAVKLDHLTSYYELGRRYLTGKDAFPKMEKEGRKLLEQAASRSNVPSMNTLAKYYLGSADNALQEKGREWLVKAAHSGSVLAMTKLAEAYASGKGMPVDSEQAEYWMGRAEQAFPCEVSELVALGRGFARGVGVSADGKKAVAYLERAATDGSIDAARELGKLYIDGLAGVERNSSKGVEWLQKAAEQGDTGSMLELGNAYAAGDGVEHSSKQALEWWKKAADAGDEDAKLQLEEAKASGLGE